MRIILYIQYTILLYVLHAPTINLILRKGYIGIENISISLFNNLFYIR